MSASSPSLPLAYSALLTSRCRSDDVVIRQARASLTARVARSRRAAWTWYAGLVVLSISGLVLVAAPGASQVRAWAVVGLCAALCTGAVLYLIARGRLQWPAQVSLQDAPAGAQLLSAEQQRELFQVATEHPELAPVVWGWIRSGHPIRVDQLDTVRAYVLHKGRPALAA